MESHGKLRIGLAGVVIATVLFAACGDSEDLNPGPSGNGGTSDAGRGGADAQSEVNSGGGGVGGSSGSAGSGNAGGTAGSGGTVVDAGGAAGAIAGAAGQDAGDGAAGFSGLDSGGGTAGSSGMDGGAGEDGPGDAAVELQYDVLSEAFDSGSENDSSTVSEGGDSSATDVVQDTGPKIPVVLALGQKAPARLAVNASYLFWTSLGTGPGKADGALLRLSLAGGAPMPIASYQDAPGGLAIDVGFAYYISWAKPGSVMRMALCGCGSPVALATGGPDYSYGIAVDASNAYWTDTDNGTVNKMSIPTGGTVTTLVSSQTKPREIALESVGGYVYWTNAGDAVSPIPGSVRRVAVAGGTAETLVDNQNEAFGIAVDASQIYWTIAGDGTGALFQAPLAGGPPQSLATGLSTPELVVVRGAYVYWINAGTSAASFTDGSVARMPLAGGALQVLASGQAHPKGLAVDDGNVYWANQGDGSIWRLAL